MHLHGIHWKIEGIFPPRRLTGSYDPQVRGYCVLEPELFCPPACAAERET